MVGVHGADSNEYLDFGWLEAIHPEERGPTVAKLKEFIAELGRERECGRSMRMSTRST